MEQKNEYAYYYHKLCDDGVNLFRNRIERQKNHILIWKNKFGAIKMTVNKFNKSDYMEETDQLKSEFEQHHLRRMLINTVTTMLSDRKYPNVDDIKIIINLIKKGV